MQAALSSQMRVGPVGGKPRPVRRANASSDKFLLRRGQGSAALTLGAPADGAIVHRQDVASDGMSRIRISSVV
eukprot:2587836-Rhodomonas_salina.1